MDEINKINLYRNNIDYIDKEIIKLLAKRADIALMISEIKKSCNMNIYVPEREHELINNLISINDNLNSDLLSPEAISNIFSIIIKECRKIQAN